MPRIAIIDENKCKPEKCSKECIKNCPPQKSGNQVIEIVDIEDLLKPNLNLMNMTNKKKIAKIFENMCIGCNQCVKQCPFNAIKIINLPEENPEHIIHRYSINGFRLYKLPIMKKNKIIGIVGENGVGKSTIIDILSNRITPNFEVFNVNISCRNIIKKFRGNILQNYFNELYFGNLTFSIKEQKIKKNVPRNNTTVKNYLKSNNFDVDLIENYPESFYSLKIDTLIDLYLKNLSGGELQRLRCWMTSMFNADVYIFDEPSNFLDVKQRLEISKLIKNLQSEDKYVIVIDHDLSILDYVCDELFIVYGKPGAYGIVSRPLTTSEGINMYLDGFISHENIRFREEEFKFKPSSEISLIEENKNEEEKNDTNVLWNYSNDQIEYSNYILTIPEGMINLTNSITIILGENGTGKTTFINWISKNCNLRVSVKEQTINIRKFINRDGTFPSVLSLLHKKIRKNYFDLTFQNDVIKNLDIESILERRIDELSGGEIQRLLIVLCLGKDADIYLLDEPSANLDIEKRLKVIKAVKKFIYNNNTNKSAFIIEHDIMMSVAFSQEYGSNILLVKEDSFENNIKRCSISSPLNFTEGINKFLELMGITMRICTNNRPRINKINSQLDREQKMCGNYYGM